MKTILLVEDEPSIRTAVRDALRARGYSVDDTVDGAEALRRARAHRYDLIVLDVMLPGLDGFEVCQRLRQDGDRTPVLMLTARGSEDDRVRGLSLGADDYMVKPFSVRELLARVDARLRRSGWSDGEEQAEVLSLDGVHLDLSRMECTLEGGDPIQLTAKEVAILRYLAQHKGRVVTQPEFLVNVWGYPTASGVKTRTVENTIGKLRKKIEPERSEPRIVLTVHGAGWKLGEEVACGS
ncbi:MAG: response regulator transcription factor [Planctomycetota bacterium]